MNGETAAERAMRAQDFPLSPAPLSPLKRILDSIPPRPEDAAADAADEIGAAATTGAMKRSEARRDAVLAVALAIQRRGQNPVTDWTTKDVDTAWAIADQLTTLEAGQNN